MATLNKSLAALFQRSGTSLVLIRHGESLGNLAGTLTGWTDVKLTEHGRRQAKYVYSEIHPFLGRFKAIYSSDLQRTLETCKCATDSSVEPQRDPRLREIYWGKDEGVHYNSMLPEYQANMQSWEYHAPDGESWTMVQTRAKNFVREKCKETGVYLAFSHGGLIGTLSYHLGLKTMVSSCGAVGFGVEEGEIRNLQFHWKCPEIDSQSEQRLQTHPSL